MGNADKTIKGPRLALAPGLKDYLVSSNPTEDEAKFRVGETALWGKALSPKPGYLSLIPRTHIKVEKNQHHDIVLHARTMVYTAHIQTIINF